MLGRVRRIAPGVVLHAARALARDPVRVRAPKARVLDRLVRIHGDVALRGLRHDLEVMARHELPVVPFIPDRSVRLPCADAAGVGDVAGLDAVDAEPLVQVERGAELLFVARDVAGGLVVADQVHAALLRVGRDRLEVEVGRRLGEAEVAPVREPVAVPAAVPALDQDAAKSVGGGEVDVALRVRRGRAMPRSRAPGLRVEVQRPPDADVLVRLEPGHVAERIRLVEVEDQVGHVEPGGIGRDLDRAPRRRERRAPLHAGPCRGRRQRRLQPLPRAAPSQPHG